MKNLSIYILLFFCTGAYSQEKAFIPDTTMNNVLIIMDKNSIIETIGDQSGKLIEDSGPSRVVFKNADSTQYIILYHLGGANANSFNEFEIGKLKDSNHILARINVVQFKTESGIKLGINEQSLLLIKGKPNNAICKNGYLVISYIIKGLNNPFLLRKNMPEYKAVYYFKNDCLEKFTYGFPNL